MTDQELTPAERLEAIARKREQKKQEETELGLAIEADDREAIFELELQHGASNISTLRIPYSGPGIPVVIALRTPKEIEVKRWRSRVKGQKGEEPDYQAASIELGETCLVYPSQDLYKAQVKARPGLPSQMGKIASALATGVEEDLGKG